MTATLRVSKKGAIIFRVLCSIAVVLSGLLAGCGPTNFNINATPTVEGLPDIKKSPLHAGVYYSPQFASHDQVRKKGQGIYHMHIGPASVSYFDQLLPRIFEKTSRVETLAPDELAKKGVDLVIAPSLEHFDFPLGMESYSERFGVTYRTTLYTPRGVPASSWVVYGTADHWNLKFFGGGHIEAYIQQAGEKFVRTFEQEGGPGLAAIASSRQRTPQPIDVAALQLSARHTEPSRLGPNTIKQLRNEGFVFVEVSATSKTSREVLVRASDMKLRLKGGQVIDTSPPSALLLVATADSATPVVAFGPLIGILATLGTEAAVSAESDKQRQLLSDAVGRSLFGEQVLRQDNGTDGGMVFFRLPPGASADGATVIAWAVELATGAGSQVEMPLLSAVPAR
jgi:hypothetical protein